MVRKKTRSIKIGNIFIGGENKIAIQSMTNTDTRNVQATVDQIKRLQDAGCDIVRLAVPDDTAAEALKKIKKEVNIPIVADIHFDYKLAIKSIINGADKIRINPGNIGSEERVKEVVKVAKEYNIPIRVGVNSGSLEKHLLKKYNGITAEGLVESALEKINFIENLGYNNLVISIKSSSVLLSIECYEIISQKTDYPLHLGITESGTIYSGSIKSAVGIGAILSRGIGDTIRVSLTDDPVKEIICAKDILRNLGLYKGGIEFISCPTCGRTEVDLISIATEIENLCKDINKNIKVAVMGCAVNGPGEAKDADIGIACGRGKGVIFKKGEVIHTLPEEKLVEVFIEEIKKM